MATSSSTKNEGLPVIWLLPPDALLPSHHPIPIHPLPIAISATLTSLILLILVILYHTKPKATTNVELANLKDSIRVVRPTSTAAPVMASRPSRPDRLPTPNQSRDSHLKDGSSTISDPPGMTYHNALKGIRDASYYPSPESPPSPFIGPSPSSGNYYYNSPNTTRNDRYKYNTQAEHHVVTAASSNYSVSVGPTPLPSRRNSLRKREVNSAWTCLQLGPEYDGDRTFVPGEATLLWG